MLAWRLSSRFGAPPVPLRLRGLDPDARYRDDDTGAVHHGAVLLAHGLAAGDGVPGVRDPDEGLSYRVRAVVRRMSSSECPAWSR